MVIQYADRIPGFGGILIAAVLAGVYVDRWNATAVGLLVRRQRFLSPPSPPTAPEGEHILVARITMIVMMGLGTILAVGIKDIGPWVFFINAAMIAPALPLAWLRWFWSRLQLSGANCSAW